MALPYSLLGLSRVSRPQQTASSAAVFLNYSNFEDLGWLRYVQSALVCFEPPWDAFRNIKWVAGELARVLDDLKIICRKKQIEVSGREDKFESPDEDKKLLVLFLCSVMTGIASVWEQLSESFDSTIGAGVQRALQPSSVIGVYTNTLDLESSQSQSNPPSTDLSNTDDDEDLESRVLGCFSSGIECLSSLTTSPALVALVCDRSNNGLLFFDCLGIADRNIRYDTLQLIQRLLCGGKLHWDFEVDNWDREEGRIEHALTTSPHSIGNLMDILEHEDAEFVRNESLNAISILLNRSEELRRIMTFQNLPEQLLSIISKEMTTEDSPHSDMTAVCFDCLTCVNFLFRSSSTQKYFHQTGLIFKLVGILCILLTGTPDLPGSENGDGSRLPAKKSSSISMAEKVGLNTGIIFPSQLCYRLRLFPKVWL